ncbi:Oligopeptide transport ATP-binding protein OppD [subsurface metagenome]
MLNIENLRVSFSGEKQKIPVLRGVTLKIEKGEVLGLAGESGCGKSITALSILGLLPVGADFDGGKIFFEDNDLLQMKPERLQRIRGKKIAMIFQEPGVSLDPLFTIGNQIGEVVERQLKVESLKLKVMEEVEKLLELVKFPKPKEVLCQYPHQLSGGMAQRAMIAMALARKPSLLIADEPTTSLDVTTEAEIIALLKELQASLGMSILFISHNLALIGNIAGRIAIMYAGRIVEVGPMNEVIHKPLHPYTRALLLCLPDPEKRGKPLVSIPGSVPEPSALLSGCAFAPRCPEKKEICAREIPKVKNVGGGHFVRCHKC